MRRMLVGYHGTVKGLLAAVTQGLLGGTWTWEFETRQADHRRRKAVLEQLVDKLADDQGLLDAEYVLAREIALRRAQERPQEPPLVVAAWAVSLATDRLQTA